MMILIGAITGLALYFTQRRTASEVQRELQSAFQSEISHLLGVHEGRLAAITERCRVLARSVRIRSALEEDDVEDLYLNAKVELRDVLSQPENEGNSRSLHAAFFRFLNTKGEVMSPTESADPSEPTRREPWEKDLALPGGAPDDQQIGYVAADSGPEASVFEVIATPIFTTDTAEVIGSIVLGFKPLENERYHVERGIKTGLWIRETLYLPGVEAGALAAATAEIVREVHPKPGTPARPREVVVGGVPHLLFTRLLNPDSRFPAAHQVYLYPLTESLARQQRLRWQILGSGGFLLLFGLAGSHLVSIGFARPVERLAEDSAQNLAQKVRAEAALVLTEQKYQSIYENAVEGIFVLGPQGHLLAANPAMARIFGHASPEQLIAAVRDSTEQLYADSLVCQAFLARVLAESRISAYEAEMVRQDGRRIWVSQNAHAVSGADGQLLNIEGTIEDITDRKHATAALQLVNTELEKALADLKGTQKQIIQQERLRALGQMASGVAHDFNNALVPILGFAELLQANPATLRDEATAHKYLGIIQTAAQDASSVVARLREFYRSREHREGFAPINLSKLIEQVVTLTRPKWKDQAQANGATIQVKTQLEPMPPITGEESALREVLTNLIFNAVDAMPSSGTITLRTQRLGESAVIEIADTGTGMTEEVRTHCLEPFYSTKGDRGTGLGLSMVFGIIQRHSGTIDIRTAIGQGTTFVLTLPLDQSAVDGSADTSNAAKVARPLRILVVDDEVQVRELLEAALTSDRHQVTLATHGVEGLKQFLEGEFDLVLTDKAMPGMSGDQLATAIKQIAPRTPIILLTGFGQFLNPEDYPDIDVLAAKPISIAVLRETIAKALKLA